MFNMKITIFKINVINTFLCLNSVIKPLIKNPHVS